MKIETRQTLTAANLRAADDQPNRIIGYAAVFNSDSEDLGGFKERIVPGAFKRTLASGHDVLALVGHERNLILGRIKNGTLTLKEDDHGLQVSIDLPDTSYARDLRESVARGDISGMSFGFSVPEDGAKMFREGDAIVRELLAVTLVEVSIVTMPAYHAATAQLRSIDPKVITQVQALQSSPVADRWQQLRHAQCS